MAVPVYRSTARTKSDPDGARPGLAAFAPVCVAVQTVPQYGTLVDPPSGDLHGKANAEAGDGTAQTVRAVDRALQIMSLLNEGRDAITLKDVLADTKLPKTTAIRLIQTLERNGLLQAKATAS